MMCDLYFGELTVEHHIDARLRHTRIIVNDDASVVLKSPRISSREALRILEENKGWIDKKLSQQKQMVDLSFRSGEEIRYMGRLYSLTDDVMFHDLNTCLQRVQADPTKEQLSRCYDRFYRARAMEYLSTRLRHLEERTGLRSKGLRFRKMRRRWGSCSSGGEITLNTRLMVLPGHLIDHVIVHELSHLRHMDHSKAFYEEMQRHHPKHRELQKELRMIRLS